MQRQLAEQFREAETDSHKQREKGEHREKRTLPASDGEERGDPTDEAKDER